MDPKGQQSDMIQEINESERRVEPPAPLYTLCEVETKQSTTQGKKKYV